MTVWIVSWCVFPSLEASPELGLREHPLAQCSQDIGLCSGKWVEFVSHLRLGFAADAVLGVDCKELGRRMR